GRGRGAYRRGRRAAPAPGTQAPDPDRTDGRALPGHGFHPRHRLGSGLPARRHDLAAVSTGALKPLRRPHLWLGLWLLAVAVVCVASLTPPPPMELPRHGDKVEHPRAYAARAAAAAQVFRPGRALWAAGIGQGPTGVARGVAQGA